MQKHTHKYFFIAFIFCVGFSFAQNENTKWYFGWGCALDFMTNPPTPLNNSAMGTQEGCASIADATGNLLFYTDGITVYNAAHTAMANGTGLNGNSTSSQSAIIVRQPGSSTIYYIFTMGWGGVGLYYSVVDMSLAAGMGSVTVKNVNLNSGASCERLSATKHTNGADYWIMTREAGTNNCKAYLLTSGGVNLTPVISSIGPTPGSIGCIKFSPDGQKFADAMSGIGVMLYDFNKTTGVLSNSLALGGGTKYGCEFSPDGTKLYAAGSGNGIIQWDLSAGSNMAIVSSVYTVTNSVTGAPWGMQLAPNGKIYITAYLTTSLHVINNPNVAGAGCNFVALGQAVGLQSGSSHVGLGLPAMFVNPCLTFTTGVGNITTCYGSNMGSAAVLAVAGNSGTPTYTWSNGINTYYTQGISSVAAGAWSVTVADTLCTTSEVVTITQPLPVTVTLTSSSPSICAGGGVLLTATASGGAGSSFTYSWSNGINFSVTIGSQALAGTHVYTAVATDANNCTGSNTISVLYQPNPPLTALPNQTICAGQSATLSTTGATGYTWQPGGANTNSIVVSPTVPVTVYTLSATNNTCGIISTVAVNYYDYPTLTVTPNQTICSNQSATLHASGASVFTWQPNSTVSNSIVVSPTIPVSIYTVSAANSICGTSETVQVNFYANPVLTITPTQSICPNFTANLSVSGANTYTWLPNNTVSNAIAVSPPITSIYSVTGTGTGGCESTETTQVFVFPLPTLSFNTHTITCANLGSATVTASGGYGAYNYTWQPTNQNGAVATGLSPNTYTVSTYDIGTACYKDSIVTFSSLIPLTGNLHHQSALKCNSVNTGTAYFTNLSGGSGNENYVWNNGVAPIITNPSPNNLSAGTWSVSVADALTGCQVYSVFTITQPPALTLNLSSSDAAICVNYSISLNATALGGTGTFNYNWLTAPSSGNMFNTTPNTSGMQTYTATAYDNNNCTVSNTISVNVVPQPTLSLALSTKSMCAQNTNHSPNTLTLTANGATTYTLSAPAYFNNSNPNASITELSMIAPFQPTGVSTATLQGSNGVCTLSITTNFSVIPNPTITINDLAPVICKGQSFAYSGSGASSYTWTALMPNPVILSTGNMAVVSPSMSSIYALIGKHLGCYSKMDTSYLTVNPIPEVLISPNDTSMCLHSTLKLTASGTDGNTYQWYPDLQTGNPFYFTPNDLQTRTFTTIATLNNCTNSAVARVSINPLPTPQIQLIKHGKCVNDSLVLKGSGGIAFEWITPNGQSHKGFDHLRIKANHEAYSGTYTFVVWDNNYCSNSKTQSITINPSPSGNINARYLEGCVPLCNTFSFENKNTTSAEQSTLTAVWQVNNKTYNTEKFTHCFNQAGNYTVHVSVNDQNNCQSSFVTQLTVYPQPVADFEFTPKEPVENADEVKFINTSKGAEFYAWSFSDINQSSYEKTPSILYKDAGTYVIALIAQSSKECLDTVVKTIYVHPEFNAYVPDIFTPNGDNLNDVFMPVTHGAVHYHLSVFDRWGHKVFETTDLTKGWDGTFKGEPAKADVYVWKIVISNIKEEKELKGTVVLQR
ncbi:MAG: gliding motility-associated C-terminal domain-containing protein [Bacteroidetes bacterium]|nr:gliding motility-associated C-terminal domain-containing protein [Bacteroidota bacterium]